MTERRHSPRLIALITAAAERLNAATHPGLPER
jgi:hypothetical protein